VSPARTVYRTGCDTGATGAAATLSALTSTTWPLLPPGDTRALLADTCALSAATCVLP
jgi:hypothetical protein